MITAIPELLVLWIILEEWLRIGTVYCSIYTYGQIYVKKAHSSTDKKQTYLIKYFIWLDCFCFDTSRLVPSTDSFHFKYQRTNMQRHILNLSPLSDVLPTATHTLSSGEADG